MSDVSTQQVETARPSALSEFWFYFRENRGAVIGLWIFAAFLIVAIGADFIAPYDPIIQHREHLLQPPAWQEGGSWAFPLGTDVVGRDMLSRLLHGARFSFFVGIVVVSIAASGGILIRLLAGFAPKWLDTIIMRVMDIILAFPSLLLALVLVAVVMSTAGVMLGMMVMQQPFSIIMTGTGIVALAGIVVNNNIVLIDTYQDYSRYMPRLQAITRTAEDRIRPVLLTTTTTVAGLAPMMIGLSIDFINGGYTVDSPTALWWKQLATAVVFGLGIATVLTLIVTPSFLALRVWIGTYATWGGRLLARLTSGRSSRVARDMRLQRSARKLPRSSGISPRSRNRRPPRSPSRTKRKTRSRAQPGCARRNRCQPGALISDDAHIVDRVERLINDGVIVSVTGEHLPVTVESLCVHGDTPAAVHMTRLVRATLDRLGVNVRAFS